MGYLLPLGGERKTAWADQLIAMASADGLSAEHHEAYEHHPFFYNVVLLCAPDGSPYPLDIRDEGVTARIARNDVPTPRRRIESG